MRLVIINPTYNERETVPVLVAGIAAIKPYIEKEGYELVQLIVDDSSPDGTATVIRSLQRKYPFLQLLEGKKEGLGKAYIRGMQYAIENLHADIIAEMDADLQHDPSILPYMLGYIQKGADLVIGSRYIPGGSYPEQWGRFRVLNSAVANILARHIAGFRQVHDCTSGYRLIRAHPYLEKALQKNLHADGYSFQLMLLAHLLQQGASVHEYPIQFAERKAGESKVGMNKRYFLDIAEFFKNAFAIRLRTMVGCFAGIV